MSGTDDQNGEEALACELSYEMAKKQEKRLSYVMLLEGT